MTTIGVGDGGVGVGGDGDVGAGVGDVGVGDGGVGIKDVDSSGIGDKMVEIVVKTDHLENIAPGWVLPGVRFYCWASLDAGDSLLNQFHCNHQVHQSPLKYV